MIECQNVSYNVGSVSILGGVTLDTSAKRIAVLGRNGSGKTTLSRALAGLITPTSGQILIGGVDVAHDRKVALRTVGILFQNPEHQIIFPTVIEEVAFGLRSMGHCAREADALALKILERYGRGHWADTLVYRLSHGQKQLLCLMSILAMSPRVIILDEPFSGLDIPTRLQLQRVFEGLEQTLVHITHEPYWIENYEYAIWLDGGCVQEQGVMADVLPAYQHKMTQLGARDDFADL